MDAGQARTQASANRRESTKDPYIQALRGMAICGVALIHCLPQSPWAVSVRPFLNVWVALFVFLSGYLTGEVSLEDGPSFSGVA